MPKGHPHIQLLNLFVPVGTYVGFNPQRASNTKRRVFRGSLPRICVFSLQNSWKDHEINLFWQQEGLETHSSRRWGAMALEKLVCLMSAVEKSVPAATKPVAVRIKMSSDLHVQPFSFIFTCS